MSNTAPVGAVPQWTTADRLVKARQVAGLTQHELAHRLGVGDRTVKRYEAGAATKHAILMAWALTCGVSLSWLITGEPPDPNDPSTIWYRQIPWSSGLLIAA